MAFTDLSTVKEFLRIPAGSSAHDSLLTRLISYTNQVITNYCKRNLETATYLEYLSGKGTQDLTTRETPLATVTLTGTLTNTSPTVTGLSSTSNLLAGMAVSGTGIPGGGGKAQPTIISSVDSSTQVTLNANATAGGSQSLTFGTAVYLDSGGFFGKASGAFTVATTLLTEGVDYVLDYAPDGTCKSGRIIRLGGGIAGTAFTALWPWAWRTGSLTARMPPMWPQGIGNIKAVYCAGYGSGPFTSGGSLPADLTEAANDIVRWMRVNALQGGTLRPEDIEAFRDQIGSTASTALQAVPELGSARQILSRYRKVVL